jgi:hypothetical protein
MILKIKNFLFDFNLKEKKLFLESLTLIYYYKLFLVIIPYKIWSKQIDDKEDKEYRLVTNDLLLLKKAMLRANKFSFWKNKCIVLSLASRKMLERRSIPSNLHLGLKIEEDKKLMAHAWLTVHDFQFVSNHGDFVKIA